MKRLIAIITVCFLLFDIAGCASLQKKFTRKKKAGVKHPRIYQLKKYEKKPTPELYKKHYAYWMTWQSEIISDLGRSHKKDVRCMEEIVGQLKDMQGILVDEKAEELDRHINRLSGIRETILKEELSQYNRHSVLQTLESEDRAIKRDFCYKKIKDYLRKGFDDEQAAEK